MTFLTHGLKALVIVGPLLLANAATAVNIETVTVGNPGNSADKRYNAAGYGSISYTYNIGKFEITAGQYCEFLNAVAATDLFGLYNTYMDTRNASYSPWGCNITRSGSQGTYRYTVDPDWANRPVNLVSWADAARFCNWMANGQPKAQAGLTTTTEDGSYFLNGARGSDVQYVRRKPNATYVIPTEDEWYKAAYYDPAKPGGAGYWDYATRSNTTPSNSLSESGINNANFKTGTYASPVYTIGAPYYRTDVGTFAGSTSAYGTFDQTGNVNEWNEAVIAYSDRGIRGGDCFHDSGYMSASFRELYYFPEYDCEWVGFRVAYLPEPASLGLMALGALTVINRRARKR